MILTPYKVSRSRSDNLVSIYCRHVFFYIGIGPLIFEFQHFLRDLLKEAKKSEEVTDDQLIEYTDTMVS